MKPLADIETQSNLTRTQLKIWLGQKLNPTLPLYNVVHTFTLHGQIDRAVFQAAFQALIDNSDALRTVVEEIDFVPRQRVLDQLSHAVEFVDLSAQPDAETACSEWLAGRSTSLLALDRHLFDTALVKLDATRTIWFFKQHHIIADGWSTPLTYQYMADYYERAGRDRLDSVAPIPAFQDYVEFERRQRSSAQAQEADAYWRAKLAHEVEAVNFHGERQPTGTAAKIVRVVHELDAARSERLRAAAQADDIRMLTPTQTLFSIFGALLFTYLHRATQAERLSIGIPIHNRPSAAFRSTPGLFISFCPFEVEIAEDETFLSLLDKIRHETLDVMRHAQFVPGDTIQDKRFNVVLNYLNDSFPAFADRPVEPEWHHAGYWDGQESLIVQVQSIEQTQRFRLHFDFNADVFSEVQQEQVIARFLKLIDAFLGDHNQPISRAEILPANELRTVQRLGSGERIPVPHRTIVEQFEAQVAETPESVAVVYDREQLTYRQLNFRVNQLAHHLRVLGIEPGAVVGICMERSLEMIVAILGVIKAGGAYMPLDPNHPIARIDHQLRESRARVLLTQDSSRRRLADTSASLLCLDSDWATVGREDGLNPVHVTTSDDLAYVIYTSGSTGQPKGVMVEHRNVLNLVRGLEDRIYSRYERGLKVALVAPYVFDASVQQIFATLLLGHTLAIVPDETRVDGKQLLAFYQTHEIDVSDGTPAHLELLAAGARNRRELPVRHLLIGGEALRRATARRFFDAFPESEFTITNVYGPAECCVDSIAFDLTEEMVDQLEAIPIGSPMPNEQVYILNDALAIQPLGMTGEICIAGDGVGRGYLHNAALTEASFIDDPFRPGDRLYRSGDVGRLRSDGQIEFVGRKDSQVKIRGHRIELGEVENRLRQFGAQQTYIELYPSPVNGGAPLEATRCRRCLLTENHPGVQLDESGNCNVCRQFEAYGRAIQNYFRPIEEFGDVVARANRVRRSEYDCLLLYSGGKDSSYVLYRLVEMGLRVLAFTFDNGFISAAAFRNIERQTTLLNVDSVIAEAGAMNEIFVESLMDDSTVCSGCFRALTAHSTRLASEKGINVVVTGLSRGQIFDTKLADMFDRGIFATEKIEENLLRFRQLYHLNNDRIADLLQVDLSNTPFDQMHFLDFFRYDDTPVDEIRAYLRARDPYWAQPQDTGFCSSNCMMNDVGIGVHGVNRGYHNYEAPLSWDIRLGFTSREDALEEVTYEVDERRVNKVLQQIGYFEAGIEDAVVIDREDSAGNAVLCAYYVARNELNTSEVRGYLAEHLPSYMIPSRFVRMDALPLTHNGKVDRRSLPAPDAERPDLESRFAAPSSESEIMLAELWQRVLDVQPIGVHDNFFDLGGASLQAIQLLAEIAETFQLDLPLHTIFEAPTIARLGERIEDLLIAELESISEDEAELLLAAS